MFTRREKEIVQLWYQIAPSEPDGRLEAALVNDAEPIELVSECVGMANAMSSFDVGGDAVRIVDKAVGVNDAAHRPELGAARLCPSLQNCGESALALDDPAVPDISESALYRCAALPAARVFGHCGQLISQRDRCYFKLVVNLGHIREVYHGLGNRQGIGTACACPIDRSLID